jgi:hypothetical protein
MAADPLTILVSTTRRPALLRTALSSIAAQTAADSITRVIVSENAGDKSSGDVTREFADQIPVEYVLRDPPLPALSHALALVEALPDDGFVAILHDDDWWMPEHLDNALARMTANPSAVAGYASYFIVSAESSMLASDTNLLFWFGSGFAPLAENWRLDEPAMLLSCLWGTPGHYSTVLARAAVYRAAAGVVYREGNPYDNDRLLAMELGRLGPVIFHPLPEAFIRYHADQDQHRFDWPQREAHLRSTTRRLSAQAKSANIDLRAHLTARLQSCPPVARETVLNALSQPWCVETLVQEQLAPDALTTYATTHSPKSKNIRYHLGRLMPPVMLEALSRRRRRT